MAPRLLSRLRKLIARSLPSVPRRRRATQRTLNVEHLEDRAVPAVAVWTNQPDYAPGSTAYIGGSGFTLGETVQLQVLHTDGTPNTGGGHDPWLVTDGGVSDLDGKADGNIQTSWYVNPDDSAASTFQLTALGLVSGASASATFTDSAPAVKLGAYGNLPTAQYLGGNLSSSQAAYAEGDGVPYRYAGSNAEEGATITVLVSYQFESVTAGGTEIDYTFDYLTGDNFSIPLTDTIRLGGAASTIPSGGWTPSASFADTIAIPDDPTISTDNAGGRNFLVFSNFANTTIQSATYLGIDPTDSHHKIIQLVLQMGSNGTGAANEAIVDFGVYWAGHLARNVDYAGPHNGASDAPGSSFKMDIRATQDRTGNIGNETSNLQSGAVVDTSLSWEKRDSNGNLLGGATFTISPDPYGSGSPLVVVDGGIYDADGLVNGQFRVEGIPFDTYTITETVAPSGYLLDADTTRVQTVSIADPTAVVGTQGTNDAGTTDESDFHNAAATATLELVKSGAFLNDGDADGFADAGEHIGYTFTVTNTGNITLTGATVTDPLLGSVTLSSTTIPVGGSVSGTATYAVTQADIDAGFVYNVATADATQSAPDMDDATVVLPANALLELTKTGTFLDDFDSDGIADPGEHVSYTFTVTNTGHMTLTGVTVTDSTLGPITLSSTTIPFGGFVTGTASYAITQADVDAGFVYNVATADATQSGPDQDDERVPLITNALLEVVKSGTFLNDGDADGFADPGETVGYTFTVTNTGHVTLHNVTVTDPLVTVTGGPIVSLAPGASDSTTFTGTYTITQADIDAGFVYNIATADSDESDPDTGDTTTPLPANALLEIIKSGTWVDGNTDGDADAGEVVNYTFTVTNTGHATLHNVTVTDPLVTVSGGPITLTPGASDSGTFTGTYILTQADVDAGFVYNVATADSDESPPDTGDTTVPLGQNALLEVVKSGTFLNDGDADGFADPGETVGYTFTVTNTGNVTLHNVTVTDPLITVTGGPISSLAVGAADSTTFTGIYVISQADIDAGFVYNIATADSDESPPDTGDTNTPLPTDALLELTKTGTFLDDFDGDGFAEVGEHISYAFTATNTGHQTLHNVTVTDPLLGSITLSSTTIPFGGSVTGTATYAITQADVDAGFVYNVATADSDESPLDTDDARTLLPANALLELTKTGTFLDDINGNGFAEVGETVGYTFTVTNTGHVTLHNVIVTDPLVTVTGGPIVSLAPGASDSTTFTGTYTITQADIDAGFVYNIATADSDESDPDTGDTTTPLPQHALLEVVKSGAFLNDGDGDGFADAGETVGYTFTVTNTGHVTLHNVTVTDPLVTVGGGPIAVLAVGASDSTTFTGTYTITQADIDAGFVSNIATADSDESDPDTGDTTTQLPWNARIDLVKTAGSIADTDSNGPDPGDTINYTFTVTNTGHVTLSSVAVTDPSLGLPITLNTTTLAPGGVATGSVTYTLTQADFNAGLKDNIATATGIPPAGGSVSDTDEAAVSLAQPPVAVNDASLNNLPGPVTLNVTGNDRDVNGNLLPSTVDLDPGTAGQQKTLTVPGQGTWSVDIVGNVTFTPQAGFTGNPIPIPYTVSDGTDLVSNQATITITYVPVGRIVVEKVVNPVGNPQNFPFDTTYGGFELFGGQSNTSQALVPGTYNVRELVPAGWDLVDVTITDPSGNSAVLDGDLARIILDPGEVVTVRFTDFAIVIPPDIVGKVEVLGSQTTAGPTGDVMLQAFYINDLYHDILVRVPSVSEVNGWLRQTQAGVPRVQIAAAFWQSPEHLGLLVDQYYLRILHRTADAAGRAGWVSAMQHGLTETGLMVALFTSAEYTANHPDDASFVVGLYTDVLGRIPSAEEVQNAVLAIGRVGRLALTTGVVNSTEAFTLALQHYYHEYLHRTPAASEVQGWLVARQSGAVTLDSLPWYIFGSPEYFFNAP